MWYFGGGGHPPWALSLLALGGGVRMTISRSIRVTAVGKIKKTICEGEQNFANLMMASE